MSSSLFNSSSLVPSRVELLSPGFHGFEDREGINFLVKGVCLGSHVAKKRSCSTFEVKPFVCLTFETNLKVAVPLSLIFQALSIT